MATYTGSDGNLYAVLNASDADETPVYKGEYVFECSGCYLGYSHTEAAHANSVAGVPDTRRCP